MSGRDNPIPKNYKSVRIGTQTAEIISCTMQGDRPVLVCSLSKSRTDAEQLTGQEISIERSLVTPMGTKPTLMWGDLPGMTVRGHDGVEIGTISHVYSNGVTDIVEVIRGSERVDIPLIETYLDLEQSPEDGILQLSVPSDTFADLWSKAPPPKKQGGNP